MNKRTAQFICSMLILCLCFFTACKKEPNPTPPTTTTPTNSGPMGILSSLDGKTITYTETHGRYFDSVIMTYYNKNKTQDSSALVQYRDTVIHDYIQRIDTIHVIDSTKFAIGSNFYYLVDYNYNNDYMLFAWRGDSIYCAGLQPSHTSAGLDQSWNTE